MAAVVWRRRAPSFHFWNSHPGIARRRLFATDTETTGGPAGTQHVAAALPAEPPPALPRPSPGSARRRTALLPASSLCHTGGACGRARGAAGAGAGAVGRSRGRAALLEPTEPAAAAGGGGGAAAERRDDSQVGAQRQRRQHADGALRPLPGAPPAEPGQARGERRAAPSSSPYRPHGGPGTPRDSAPLPPLALFLPGAGQ